MAATNSLGMKPRGLVMIALLVLVAPLPASTGSACAGVAAAPPDFDSLPVAPAGVLPGRIVYLNAPGCALREQDLGTGSDRLVRTGRTPIRQPLGAHPPKTTRQ